MSDTSLRRRSRDPIEALSAEDFDTSSIHSVAPSYSSEVPPYHYTVPNNDMSILPPYTPPSGSASASTVAVTAPARHQSAPTLPAVGSLVGTEAQARRVSSTPAASPSPAAVGGSGSGYSTPGFSTPNTPSGGRVRGEVPSLSQFRISTWSTISSNPTARHYHSVALRRVAAAENASAAAEIGNLVRRLAILERLEQEEAAASSRRLSYSNNSNGNLRPLEDPYLVGETAARRARAERLTRENVVPVEDALTREDRRWDWFLGSFARPSNLPSSHRIDLPRRRQYTGQSKGQTKQGMKSAPVRIKSTRSLGARPLTALRHLCSSWTR